MVLAGISVGGHTDLHVFHRRNLTGVRYRYEIFDAYVWPYAVAYSLLELIFVMFPAHVSTKSFDKLLSPKVDFSTKSVLLLLHHVCIGFKQISRSYSIKNYLLLS